MIGAWLTFGEGPPPEDGEALVYIRAYGGDLIDALEGRTTEAVIAIHRYGMLYEQNGNCYFAPFGLAWTSLPAPGRRHPAAAFRGVPFPIIKTEGETGAPEGAEKP